MAQELVDFVKISPTFGWIPAHKTKIFPTPLKEILVHIWIRAI